MSGPASRQYGDTNSEHEAEDLTGLAEQSVALVDCWLQQAAATETASERRTAKRLASLLADPAGVAFAMGFVDRVIRPEDNRVAARQLADLALRQGLPRFLSPLDRLLLRAGARLAPLAPALVMGPARRRLRSLVGHLVVDADPEAMAAHLRRRRDQGFRLNINLIGEAVLGEQECWVSRSMEEYHDLELTKTAFMSVLDEPRFLSLDAGIVLLAYLSESFDALRELAAWAAQRGTREMEGRSGGTVKVRLVKGANLAMERVEAAMHGWPQAPYASKAETDANYKRCLDWLMMPQRLRSMRLGIASHNLFDLAFAKLLAQRRG